MRYCLLFCVIFSINMHKKGGGTINLYFKKYLSAFCFTKPSEKLY